MKKISILVVEDNRLLREGICAMLKTQADMNVVATVGNGENILLLIEKVQPDILLLDLGLRSQNSLEVVKLVSKGHEQLKIIVMDLIPTQKDVYEFVQAGVAGFILKDANIADFYSTIRSVFQGAKVLPPNLTDSLFSQIIAFGITDVKPSVINDSIRMTKRERQVVELIAEGCANKEIAQKLHLSTFTIKSHVHNILEKLSLHTRVQVANYAHDSENQ
ncbi:MAG: response regulator transcription factor [Ignavibacteriales bacterium]|nr:response regulator transcription factor [Ignavibacteriales bacterium]